MAKIDPERGNKERKKSPLRVPSDAVPRRERTDSRAEQIDVSDISVPHPAPPEERTQVSHVSDGGLSSSDETLGYADGSVELGEDDVTVQEEVPFDARLSTIPDARPLASGSSRADTVPGIGEDDLPPMSPAVEDDSPQLFPTAGDYSRPMSSAGVDDSPPMPHAPAVEHAPIHRASTMAIADTDLEEVTETEPGMGLGIPAAVIAFIAEEPPVLAPALASTIAKDVAHEPPPPPPSKKRPPPAPLPSPQQLAPRAKAWFDEIFDEDYLRTLPLLTPVATQSETNFVIEALGLDSGTQILDAGCGYGRHAMELAARGYQIVGLDNSLPLLLRGAEEAQRRGLAIHFVHGDMRDIQFDAQFDGAYCLFNTFGYFDDEMNKKTALNLARSLKPGARLVVDVLNRDYVIADLPSRVWWEGDGCVVLEEVDFNYFSSRIVSNRSLVFDDGRQLEQEISIRAFSLHEIGKLLHSVGLRVLEISGSMATRGRFFGAQSRDLVVVAERR